VKTQKHAEAKPEVRKDKAETAKDWASAIRPNIPKRTAQRTQIILGEGRAKVFQLIAMCK